MLWQIRSFPSCDYHVFLSHSQEDRDPLIEPTRKKLASRGVVPWFDREDYYCCNLLLPLFFVDQTDPRLPRSFRQAVRDRGRFCEAWREREQVAWAFKEIFTYLVREQSLAGNHSDECKSSPKFRDELETPPGLRDRVTKFEPSRLRIR